MGTKSQIKGLLSDARNSRRLAAMTTDISARQYLEQVAERYDEQRVLLETEGSDAGAKVAMPSDLSLDRMMAIHEVADRDAEQASWPEAVGLSEIRS